MSARGGTVLERFALAAVGFWAILATLGPVSAQPAPSLTEAGQGAPSGGERKEIVASGFSTVGCGVETAHSHSVPTLAPWPRM